MKFLNDRTEIAKAINLSGNAVIRIDISKNMRGYDDCYEGDKIILGGKDYPIRCTVNMYGDDAGNECHDKPYFYKKIKLMPETIGISSRFGYGDVMEMAEWNRVPTVNAGDTVIVVFDDSNNNVCYIRLMKVGKVSEFVYPAAMLYDIDEEGK